MDEKTKELVAIGASVCAHCQPCVTFHVAKARELGVAEELIREAVAVGQAVEKGAGAAMREFAAELIGCGAGQAEKGRHPCAS
jgi:AhpD family alkylhydroperoxidase